MKKFIALIFTLCLFCSSQVSAYGGPITADWDMDMTTKLGYPVVKIHNNYSKEILVEYNYFLDESKNDNENYIELSVPLQPNETKELHFKNLSFLNDTNETRNILFSYNFNNVLKPTQLGIITPIFSSENIVYPELG